MFARHHLWVAGLCLAIGSASCDRDSVRTSPTNPPDPKQRADIVYPVDESQFVLHLSPNADPTAVAAELGLEFVSQVVVGSELVALFDNPGSGVPDVDLHPSVLTSSTNGGAFLAEGEARIVGFYEGGGWSRVEGDGQEAFASMNLEQVHEVATGAGVTMAVLDTGADMLHGLLRHNSALLPDHYELSQSESSRWGPAFGHGTAVAGAAVLVAPDVTVLPIRVLDEEGVGSVFQVYRGLAAAISEEVDVINLSLSLSQYDALFDRMLQAANSEGIVVVCAAGNHGYRNPRFPASSPHTVGVAAVDNDDNVPSFSGIGANIRLAAAGIEVYSSYPGYGYALLTGTSVATPLVSACVSLLLETGARPSVCVDRLVATSAPVYIGDPFDGLGRVRPDIATAGQ